MNREPPKRGKADRPSGPHDLTVVSHAHCNAETIQHCKCILRFYGEMRSEFREMRGASPVS